jgi:hypothetical protein
MKPHKHAELIKAWADGYTIQYKDGYGWWDWDYPDWDGDDEYRIKPEQKPDYSRYIVGSETSNDWYEFSARQLDENLGVIKPQIKITFDGETGKIKSVEVLK